MTEKIISKDGKYFNDEVSVHSYDTLSTIIEDTIVILDILSTNAGDSPLSYDNSTCFRNNYNFYSAIVTLESILSCCQRYAFSDYFCFVKKVS